MARKANKATTAEARKEGAVSRLNKVVKAWSKEGRENVKNRGTTSIDKAKAYKIRKQGQAATIEAKADLAKARQGARKTRYRAAAVASLAASRAEAARANESARIAALDKWNSIINSTATPAEGTGAAQTGDDGGTGASTTASPVGN